MLTKRPGHHRTPGRQRSEAVVVALLVLLGLAGLAGFAAVQVRDRPVHSGAHAPLSTLVSTPSRGPDAVLQPSTVNSGAGAPAASSRSPAPTHTLNTVVGQTPQGKWWGVDSTLPITTDTLANVRAWYRGHPRPQFWGRYLGGRYGVTSKELTRARTLGIYVYLIIGDRNCSSCGSGDVCGNDRTTAQARTDAQTAVEQAHSLRLPARTTLFKDIEQVSSCSGEPTADYLLTWYHTLASSSFHAGFYGNVHEQSYDFPVAYCHAMTRDPSLGTKVTLAMNENEPRIGAPRGSTGPHNAPRFHPNSPHCAPPSATKIWQYGESLTPANRTDIDQAQPDAPGLLAPDGTATA